MTKRLEEARASPKPTAHEGGPRPTGNSYFSVTAPNPGTRPEAVRAAHSPPGGGEQAPSIESNLSSASRANSPLANSEAPVADAAPAAPNRTRPATMVTVRSTLDTARMIWLCRALGHTTFVVSCVDGSACP